MNDGRMKTEKNIPPYRAQMITKTAADITERLISGKYLFNPTYEECEIVIGIVADTLEKCKNARQEGNNVLKQGDF